MQLSFTVVSVESASVFVDKGRRVTLRIEQADSMFSDIRLPDPEGEFQLDDRGVAIAKVVEVPKAEKVAVGDE